jgi:hypothetical protein
MTYLFTNDYCTGGCGPLPVGSVVTSDAEPGVIDVVVTLFHGAFHDSASPQDHALAFDLTGTPNITVSDLQDTPFLTADGPEAPGTVHADGAGTFEYAINFPHVGHPPLITQFSFDISGPGVTLASFAPDSLGNFFATDIWAGSSLGPQTGNTGDVGAVLASPIPEPTSWALMLVGFGTFGALLRARRAAALRQAA